MSRIIIITPPPPPPGDGRNAESINELAQAEALAMVQDAISTGARIRIVDTDKE